MHLLLRWNKVAAKHIYKVVHSGNLYYGGQDWSYHIATMVWLPQSGFVVIDPLFEAPLPLKVWVRRNEVFMRSRTASDSMFHIVDAAHYNFYQKKHHVRFLKMKETWPYFRELGRDLAKHEKAYRSLWQ